MNEFGDSYIKEELQGGYGYSYDDQYLEIFLIQVVKLSFIIIV